MTPLTLTQTFEALTQTLEKTTGPRPVFLTGRWLSTSATHIKFPGEGTFVSYPDPRVRPLSRFLTTLDSPVCHERDGQVFRYIAKPSKYLYLAVPMARGERDDLVTAFREAGVKPSLDPIGVSVNPTVDARLLLEHGLSDYVIPRTRPKGSYQIPFLTSIPYIRPLEERGWHTGPSVAKEEDNARAIHPPGKYDPDVTMTVAKDWNRYLVSEIDPGPCIACRGQSGDRKHFGHTSFGPRAYPNGLICRSCFGPFAKAVTKLLGD